MRPSALAFLLLAAPALAADRIERRRAPGQSSPGPQAAPSVQAAPAPAASERVRIVPGTPPAQPAPQYHYYWANPYPYQQRWYYDHWWWQHPYDHHWRYWDDGYWRRAPRDYAPPPSDAPAAPPPSGASKKSPDGTRLVQIAGPSSDAFLYDVQGSSASARFIGRLASGVEDARFSGGDGKPLKIMLTLREGGFALFDRDGKPLDAR